MGENPRHLPWRVTDVFIVLAAYALLLYVFLHLRVQLFGSIANTDPDRKPGAFLFDEIVDAGILTTLPLFFVTRVYGGKISEIGITLDNVLRNVILGAAAGVLLFGAASGYDIVLSVVFGVADEHPYHEMFRRSSSPAGSGAILFTLLVLGPFSEEVFFRGFAYTVFRKRWGISLAVVVSATLFSVTHFSTAHFVLAWGIGAALALLFDRTKSLLSSIAAHAVFNVASVSFSFLSS